jgi:hypothetical protein
MMVMLEMVPPRLENYHPLALQREADALGCAASKVGEELGNERSLVQPVGLYPPSVSDWRYSKGLCRIACAAGNALGGVRSVY